MSIRSAILFALLVCVSCGNAQADLVAFFDFDGNATDQSSNNTRAIVRSNGYSSGFEGQALNLSSSLNFVFVSLDESTQNQPVQTFGAWVRTQRPSVRQSILTIEDFDNSLANRSIGIDDRASGSWQYTATTGPNQFTGLGGPPDTDWTFVAGRYDGSNVTMFIDDQSITTADNTGRNTGRQSYLRVGDVSFTGAGFRGEIDNLFLFNEALTDTQINTIRTNGRAGIMAVAIPEPSVFGLGLLSLAGISLRRNRRERH